MTDALQNFVKKQKEQDAEIVDLKTSNAGLKHHNSLLSEWYNQEIKINKIKSNSIVELYETIDKLEHKSEVKARAKVRTTKLKDEYYRKWKALEVGVKENEISAIYRDSTIDLLTSRIGEMGNKYSNLKALNIVMAVIYIAVVAFLSYLLYV